MFMLGPLRVGIIFNDSNNNSSQATTIKEWSIGNYFTIHREAWAIADWVELFDCDWRVVICDIKFCIILQSDGGISCC